MLERGPKITPLTTGTVRLKEAMARGLTPGRQLRLFLPGKFGPALPIHAWLIEHQGGKLLVDAGHHKGALNSAFARFQVTEGDHLDVQLRALGVKPDEIDRVVLTHVHPDHADGVRFLPGVPVLVAEAELDAVRSPPSAVVRVVTRSPLPPAFSPTTFRFGDGPIGTFEASHRLTPDGTVRAVPAPGHTPGHTAVLVDAGDHDVLIAGDIAYDQQQLMDLQPDGVSQSFVGARETMQRVLDHARQRPTVFLPTHDRESIARLEARTTIPVAVQGSDRVAEQAVIEENR